MKKLLLALGCVLMLSCAAFAAQGDETVDGVWGLRFGTSVHEANRVMTQDNGAQLLTEYTYLPNYSEALYRVNFFGREGHMLLRFSKKGLFLARFSFVRKDALKSEAERPEQPRSTIVDARNSAGAPEPSRPDPAAVELSRNFVQLNTTLTKKYGPPKEEYKEGDAVIGRQWADKGSSRRTITLYESRSLSRSDTVLTYEDASRR